jgi:hypothetical protein
MIFESHHAIQNQILGLAHGMRARYRLAKVLQIKALNMIPHIRNALKGMSLLFVRKPLVPNAEDTLSLT